MRLILASTSQARRSLINALGIPYEAIAPGVDEVVPPATSPEDAVQSLSARKAHAVFGRHPDALVIGSDQLVSLDGVALGKPADATAARAQLASLSGRSHEIFTGLCVLGPGYRRVELDRAVLTVHPLSPAELDGYVATNEWEGCAGGYRIEARGQALFSSIDGDRTAIQGLPMQRLTRLLREAGVRFF